MKFPLKTNYLKLSIVVCFALNIVYTNFVLKPYYFIKWTHTDQSSLVYTHQSETQLNDSLFSDPIETVAYLFPKCNCVNSHRLRVRNLKQLDGHSRYIVEYIQNGWNETFSTTLVLNLTSDEIVNHTITCDLFNELRRGKHQKVIAYSLYGQNMIYYNNLAHILRLARQVYTQFFVRIYHDETLNQTMRCHLECEYSDVVDFCDIERLALNLSSLLAGGPVEYRNASYMNKMMWRFLPSGDWFVDVFLSRDSDSLFSQRELDSVNEWLNSSNLGHIMRGTL